MLGILVLALQPVPIARATEFPGPLTLTQEGLSLSASGVRIPGADRDDFLAGSGGGFLNLNRFNPTSRSFTLLHRFFVGGEVRAIIPWRGRPASAPGAVVSTANPDRLLLVSVGTAPPYLRIEAEVPLEEDPGDIAFVGDAGAGPWEIAVALPGADRVAVVAGADTAWDLADVVACGDRPSSLTAIDLDGDGLREAVMAHTGPLSGDLGSLRRVGEGDYLFEPIALADGVPAIVRAFEVDGDGRDELIVALSDRAVALVCDPAVGEVTPVETVALTANSQSLHLDILPDGQVGLVSANGDRGLLEYSARAGGLWQRRDILYPGCRPSAVTFADVDGDDLPDLLTAGGVSEVLTVMLGLEDGNFAGIRALSLSVSPGAFTYDDFDGDGREDLVIADANRTTVRMFRGEPAGGLALTPTIWDLGFVPGRILSVSLDGQPGPELVALDIIGDAVVVLRLEPGVAPTVLSNTDVGSFPFFVASGDLDADGAGDLLVLTQAAPEVSVLFGDGAGGFAAPTRIGFGSPADWIVPIDLNGDGQLDLAATDGQSRVWTRLGDGSRGFGDQAFVNAGIGALQMATGDLDGDGDDDLVVANRSEETLSFFENDGSGSLVRRIGAHSLPARPAGIELQDFDQDNQLDVLVNLQVTGELSLVFAVRPWSYAQPAQFPGGPQMTGIEAVDLNLDGVPDILALDRSLLLGLALINTDPSIVAVAPDAVVSECSAAGWRIAVRPDRAGPWQLELGRGADWRPVLTAGRAHVGRVDWDGSRWLLDLPATAARSWVADGAGDWQVRLTVGTGSDRESEVWTLPAACLGAGGATPPRLAWRAPPWPNPFNPRVHARFSLGRPGDVEAAVYDLAGRRIAVLLEGPQPAGEYRLQWDGRGPEGPVGAGLYLLRIATPGQVLQHKLTLVK